MASTSTQIENLSAAIESAWELSDFEETGSVTRAIAFRTAVRRLILITPRDIQKGGPAGERVAMDLAALAKLADDAKEFIRAASSNTNQFAHVDLTYFRE